VEEKIQVSNNKLSRIFSVEIVGSLLVTAFLVGGSYFTLANSQENSDREMKSVKAQQASMSKDISKIQTDTAVILNEQKHMTKTLEHHNRDIKKILELLMERRP